MPSSPPRTEADVGLFPLTQGGFLFSTSFHGFVSLPPERTVDGRGSLCCSVSGQGHLCQLIEDQNLNATLLSHSLQLFAPGCSLQVVGMDHEQGHTPSTSARRTLRQSAASPMPIPPLPLPIVPSPRTVSRCPIMYVCMYLPT